MLYNNLIYFLVVIFVFSTNTPPKEPWLQPLVALPCFFLLIVGYALMAERVYRTVAASLSQRYFVVEKRMSMVAVLVFVFSVYVFDLKYYFQPLSFGGSMPMLQNAAGLGFFFCLLAIMWLKARPLYQELFHRSYTARAFVVSNIKANLPIVLPWLALSFSFDLLALLPFSGIQEVLASFWGDVFVFGLFIVFLILFFPPLVRWLWGCKPMPPGPLRDRIVAFCRSQGFHSEILHWPLFEGQVLTAGIMGIIPNLRYLLITPALLNTLNESELDSVLAHEIGHVKKLHLLLYVTLFLGFSILVGSLSEPLPYFILSSDLFYGLLRWLNISPQTLLGGVAVVPFLLLMILYFRFVFGYFIRNFERQADLYVFKAQGTSSPLIASFEKIARLSGNIRDEKNWHHFGIGERIEFLEHCEQDRTAIRRHDKKVYLSLAAYFFCIVLVVFSMRQIDVEQIAGGYEIKYAEAVLLQKARQEPENSQWFIVLGEFMLGNKLEMKAVEAYEKALAISPLSGRVNNNLAWLLLTAKDKMVLDSVRALSLARAAVMIDEQGYNMDTLAMALWANGFVEEALKAEVKAAKLDPENLAYYRSQVEKFQQQTWAQQVQNSME